MSLLDAKNKLHFFFLLKWFLAKIRKKLHVHLCYVTGNQGLESHYHHNEATIENCCCCSCYL